MVEQALVVNVNASKMLQEGIEGYDICWFAGENVHETIA